MLRFSFPATCRHQKLSFLGFILLGHRKSDRIPGMKVFYCCQCKKVYISSPGSFNTCPDCGKEVVVTDLSPQEWEEMSEEEQKRILKYLESQVQGKYNPPEKAIGKKVLKALFIIVMLFIIMCAAFLVCLHLFIPALIVLILFWIIMMAVVIFEQRQKKSKK